jgi:hypothetical protein|tara:strand:- start:2862 stop:3143 length:282 start_codon:yes stop_codon:yes gene_type:complete
MSLIDNTSTLLREQLGKGSGVVFTTAAQTGKDWYAVHFVTESVVSAITMTYHTGEAALHTTIPAGTVIFGHITAITMTSGVAIGYAETDGKAG